MRDYTPITEDVRDTYIEGRWEMFPDSKRDDLYWASEFDRWLAEVKAQAWQEGWDTKPPYQKINNPYRQGEEQ